MGRQQRAIRQNREPDQTTMDEEQPGKQPGGEDRSVAMADQFLLRSSEDIEKMFGSTEGELYITRTSPLRGSRAITAPLSVSGNA